MALMAWEESKRIVRELVEHMPDCVDLLYSNCYFPEDIAGFINEAIEDFAPYGKLGMKAAVDLSRSSCIYRCLSGADHSLEEEFFVEIEERRNAYIALGYSGMVFMLSIYQFLGLAINYDSDPDPFTDSTTSGDYDKWHSSFRNSCDKFSLEIQELMNKVVIPDDFPALRSRRLLIPRRLIKSPRIRVFLQNKTVKDVLGRSVALLEYDAGLSLTAFDLTDDVPDFMGRTILHAACVRNDVTTINLLREKGLIHNATMEGDITPLHIVACTGNTYIFFLLCREYEKNNRLGDALMALDYGGKTFLWWAAAHGHHELIDSYLSTHKFKSDERGFLDQTNRISHSTDSVVSAFESAIFSGWDQTVQVMAKHLSSPTFWDADHRTPLWYGCCYGRTSVIPSLLRLGSTHVLDVLGSTPLMEASKEGFVEIVNFLLHPNAGETAQMAPPDLPDAWATDRDGKTAKDLAEENGHHECARILSDWMAIQN